MCFVPRRAQNKVEWRSTPGGWLLHLSYVEHEEYPRYLGNDSDKIERGGCHSSQSSARSPKVYMAASRRPVTPLLRIVWSATVLLMRCSGRLLKSSARESRIPAGCYDKVLAEYRASIHGVLAARASL